MDQGCRRSSEDPASASPAPGGVLGKLNHAGAATVRDPDLLISFIRLLQELYFANVAKLSKKLWRSEASLCQEAQCLSEDFWRHSGLANFLQLGHVASAAVACAAAVVWKRVRHTLWPVERTSSGRWKTPVPDCRMADRLSASF